MQQASPLADTRADVRGRSCRVRHSSFCARARFWNHLALTDEGTGGRDGNRSSSHHVRCGQQSVRPSHREECRDPRCCCSLSHARQDDPSVLGGDRTWTYPISSIATAKSGLSQMPLIAPSCLPRYGQRAQPIPIRLSTLRTLQHFSPISPRCKHGVPGPRFYV